MFNIKTRENKTLPFEGVKILPITIYPSFNIVQQKITKLT